MNCRMRKNLTMLGLLAVLPFGFAPVWADGTHDDIDRGPIAATVNGTEIYQLSVDRVTQQIQAQGQQADKTKILQELINLEVLTQAAEEAHLEADPDVSVALRLQYVQTLANAFLAKSSETIEITEEQLRAAYDNQEADMSQQEYNASHILLESDEAATAVIAQLKDGADFAELAKTESTGPSGPNGGELGWFQAATMVPEFSAAVATMEVGAISEEPVQTQFGWHVIKLNDTRGAAKPEYESVKGDIYNSLMRESLEKTVNDLREAATIETM